MNIFGADPSVSPEDVVSAIRPELSAHFKPALVGRMTVVPYGPLNPETMRSIVRLKLNKLCRRVQESHGVQPTIAEELIDEITQRCTEVETGARNVDSIMRGSLMPLVARELLTAMSGGSSITGMDISLTDSGSFQVDVAAESSN